MEYLVLGANGYIGRYLYDLMRQEGVNEIGTGHCCKSAEDLLDYDILRDFIKGIKRQFHDKEKQQLYVFGRLILIDVKQIMNCLGKLILVAQKS